MSSSLQTLCRSVRAPSTVRAWARVLSLGANQPRWLSTITSPDISNGRDTAVRDAIMDKLWGVGVIPPVASVSPVSPAANTPTTSMFAGRDPPLGTSAFEPSAAPRWSGQSHLSHHHSDY